MNSLTLPLQRPRHSRRGFTLIEILIVVAIIVILAGIVVAIGVGVSSGAKERATKNTMNILDGAMKDFLRDHPEPNDTNWIGALQAYPSTASTIAGKVTLDSSNKAQILDGFGFPIHYLPAHSTAKNLPFGIFQSYGRDGIPSSDDIYSAGTGAQ